MSGLDCRNCGGTGWDICHRTWFMPDGFYRIRCGLCGGTGKSRYRLALRDARWKEAARAVVKLWGSMKPATPEDAVAGLAIMNAVHQGKTVAAALMAANPDTLEAR